MFRALGPLGQQRQSRTGQPDQLQVSRGPAGRGAGAGEGLARCPQKELSLALWADRGLCRLRVENTFDGTLLQDHEGNFKTRKAGTSLHGMGLDSVRRALSSLDGFLQVRIEGRRFIAEAIWYLPEHPQTTDITS